MFFINTYSKMSSSSQNVNDDPTGTVVEGTYGCMHRPPLQCKDNKYIDVTDLNRDRPLPEDFYDNKVSKLMAIEDATKEQSENDQMDRKDPNGLYHYVDPVRCRTDPSNATKRRIKQCKVMGETVLKDTDSYQLLLMEDGGNNLKQFVQSLDPTNVNETKDRLFHFWHQVPTLLRGLRNMQHGRDDNEKLVHLDIKPENIVYNEKQGRSPTPIHKAYTSLSRRQASSPKGTGLRPPPLGSKLALIDFGLMHTFADIKEDADRNKFGYATFHWNFAPELYFYNKATYQSIGHATDAKYNTYIHDFETAVQENQQRTRTEQNEPNQSPHLFKKYNESLFHFIRNIIPHATMSDIRTRAITFLPLFKQMVSHIRNNPTPEQYNTFLTYTIPRIDVYGMGLSLAYVLTHTSSMFIHENADIHEFVTKLLDLYKDMINPNVWDRIDIDTALNRYEEVLRTDPACTKWSREHNKEKSASSNILPPPPSSSPSPIYWHAQGQGTKARGQGTKAQGTPITRKRKLMINVPDRPGRKVQPRTESYGGNRSRHTSRHTYRK
jgi:serine/threonine protein kinase